MIGVPVGFVNVVQSKELIMQADVPYIVARGRKGGSNIAAASAMHCFIICDSWFVTESFADVFQEKRKGTGKQNEEAKKKQHRNNQK